MAIGPYLWASSVDANVSLGQAKVDAGGDFMDLQRNARWGASAAAEIRVGRFAVYGDMMYGVVGLDGSREVGPLMVTLAGTASSLMADGTLGVVVAGARPGDRLSLEARGGVRYQRTVIDGSVSVGGSDVTDPRYVDAAADAVVGAQAVARPLGWLALTGAFDLGVVGSSTRTWSAAADLRVRVTGRVRLSLGWRTLTSERPQVSLVMHGPRAAVQLTF